MQLRLFFVVLACTQLCALGAAMDDDGCPVPAPCDQPQNAALPFCNTKLPLDARVKDLVARVPLNESSVLFGNTAGAIASLKLPPYQWWSEALHGVAYSPGVHYGGNISNSTSFPQVCTTGATFNKTLFSHIGNLVGREARAMNNLCHAGLTFWAPNINIFRDPRWGRGQEVAGEDPYLVATYAANFVSAMQNNSMDPSRLRVSSCCKHFTAYDVEGWGGHQRYDFNAVVSDYDMATSFMPPFESCVHRDGGHGSSIMCSYNAVNGVPMCANRQLMNDQARAQWGFEGYVTSDCGATQCVEDNHHYTKTPDETLRAVLNAGEDIDCGNFIPKYLSNALKHGAVTEAAVREALTNQFAVLFRLGYFDPAAFQPYKKLNASDVNTEEAQRTALLAAQEGIVLLHNTGLLPLKNILYHTIAVMGPNADATETLLGNYYGKPPYIVSPLAGIKTYCDPTYLVYCKPIYYPGVDSVASTDVGGFAQACTLASQSDLTILFMGNNQSIESEGNDRLTISLPGVQDLFIHHVASCAQAANKSKIIVVVFSGGSVDYSMMLSHPHVGALVWAGYPGQAGGQAVADILFGSVSPSGRLPHTVYPSTYVDQVSMLDMQMSANASSGSPGRTYRYYTGPAVFPFGYGLSYTNWSVKQVSPPPGAQKAAPTTTIHYEGDRSTIIVDAPASVYRAVRDPTVLQSAIEVTPVWVNVTNTGTRPGRFSVLLFVKPQPPGPLVGGTLADFAKVYLGAGQSEIVEMKIKANAVAAFDAHSPSKQSLRPGLFRWWILDGPSGELRVL